MNRKGFEMFAIFLTIVGGIILFVVTMAMANPLATQAATLWTNQSGIQAANQTAAVYALAPQISTLWIFIAIGILIAMIAVVFGRVQG